MAHILIVGPDPDAVALLRFACARVPHDVSVASGLQSALTLAQQGRPDLTIIDTALPGRQGLVLIQQLRAASLHPIIMLTPRRDDALQIACFDAGADDCVSLPCTMAVLLRRVRAHLSSASRRLPAPTRADVGASRIDVETHTLSGVRGHASVTPTEERLLRQLLAAQGHPVSIRALAQRLWGPYPGADSAVKSHMYHLRRKLRATGGASPRVETVRGVGYQLIPWASVDHPVSALAFWHRCLHDALSHAPTFSAAYIRLYASTCPLHEMRARRRGRDVRDAISYVRGAVICYQRRMSDETHTVRATGQADAGCSPYKWGRDDSDVPPLRGVF